jgi:nucleoside-diphosphate-sugar epimerase
VPIKIIGAVGWAEHMNSGADRARVLVAGGAGFVGSAVVRDLVDRGFVVGVLDNFFHGSRQNLHDLSRPLAFQADVDATCLPDVLHAFVDFRPSHVISCIGDTFVRTAYREPQRFFANNVETTLNVLLAASSSRVRHVVYASSTEIYGDQTGVALTEDAPIDPQNTYAVTKTAADRLCHTFGIEHGLQVTVARLFNTYGPRETHAYIIPDIIDQLSRGPELRLGNLNAARDLTFVEDTARALTSLLLRDDLPHRVYNLGSGVAFGVLHLVKLIAAEIGLQEVTISTDAARIRRRDIDGFTADPSRLIRDTGWRPSVALDLGITRTVEWFYRNGCEWPWKRLAEERSLDSADKLMVGDESKLRLRVDGIKLSLSARR